MDTRKVISTNVFSRSAVVVEVFALIACGGEYYGWDTGKNWYVKTMYVKPQKRLSLQYHHHRSERWILVEGDLTAVIVKNGIRTEHPLKVGDTFIVHKGTAHRLMSKRGGVVVEVAIGRTFNEEDIVRLEDDHGRTTT